MIVFSIQLGLRSKCDDRFTKAEKHGQRDTTTCADTNRYRDAGTDTGPDTDTDTDT